MYVSDAWFGSQYLVWWLQMSRLYPYIAKRDSEEQVFAYWLRSLNDRNFHFSQWKKAAFKEPARCATLASPRLRALSMRKLKRTLYYTQHLCLCFCLFFERT